jgi:hypothetical protein
VTNTEEFPLSPLLGGRLGSNGPSVAVEKDELYCLLICIAEGMSSSTLRGPSSSVPSIAALRPPPYLCCRGRGHQLEHPPRPEKPTSLSGGLELVRVDDGGDNDNVAFFLPMSAGKPPPILAFSIRFYRESNLSTYCWGHELEHPPGPELKRPFHRCSTVASLSVLQGASARAPSKARETHVTQRWIRAGERRMTVGDNDNVAFFYRC